MEHIVYLSYPGKTHTSLEEGINSLSCFHPLQTLIMELLLHTLHQSYAQAIEVVTDLQGLIFLPLNTFFSQHTLQEKYYYTNQTTRYITAPSVHPVTTRTTLMELPLHPFCTLKIIKHQSLALGHYSHCIVLLKHIYLLLNL